MLRLVAMSAPEFERYLVRAVPTYAADIAQATGWDPAKARATADAQVAGILPEGMRTKGQHVTHLEGDGARVGALWFAEQLGEAPPGVYIYDLVVDAEQRGRGIGTQAMHALEEEARRLGAEELRLSVFTHNPGAIRLYERLGFAQSATDPRGMEMAKPIRRDAKGG